MTDDSASEFHEEDVSHEDDIQAFIGYLTPEADDLEITFRTLIKNPLADARIIPHIERFLSDTTPCVVGFPPHYGEIRWMAARALRSEYLELGIRRTVSTQGFPMAVSGDLMGSLAEEHKIRERYGHLRPLAMYAKLRDMGVLPIHEE